MTTDFQNWATDCQAHIEAFLDTRLPAVDCVPIRLHKAMRYPVLGGGKRVRPLLSFAAGELGHADKACVTIVAASVELIHLSMMIYLAWMMMFCVEVSQRAMLNLTKPQRC